MNYLEGFDKDPLYTINPNAKNILFRFDLVKGKPVIVLPKKSYLKKICLHRDAYNKWVQRLIIPQIKVFKEGLVFPYRGINHTIHCIEDPLYVKSKLEVKALANNADPLLIIYRGRKKESLSRVINTFLMEKACEIALERSLFYAQELGVTLGNITVKELKTMWGRCLRQRDLCYNWRLILAPIEIFNYVCAHEVSHCVHFNHSKKFWETVESLDPNYKEHRAWLKKSHHNLMSYAFDDL